MNLAHISGARVPILHKYGGANERRIIEIAKEQARRKHNVTVYSIGEQRETTEVEGVTIKYIHCLTSPPLRDIEFQKRVVNDIGQQQTKYDALHFHGTPEGAFLSRGLKTKTLLSYDYFYFRRVPHTPLFPLYRRFLKRFDALLPVSEFCLEESREYWRLPSNKFTVVHNGVNMRQFRPDKESGDSEKDRIGVRKKVILYVGRVCEQKGSDILLEAYTLLSTRRDDVQLIIAGPVASFGTNGNSRGWPERIEKTGGLYLGAVEEDRLGAIYNMADVFVMPTRQFEMFCMAAVEAQACGVPVVASDHGGLREVVPENCGGRFRVGDPFELGRKIESLLDDDNRRNRCSLAALDNASRFDWSRIATTLESVYA